MNQSPPNKRGRRPGTGGPNVGSLQSKLEPLAVGEALWIETTAEDYAIPMRQASTVSRFPIGMKDRRYTTQLFTAIATGKVGEVRVLLRVERTA